MLSVIHSVSDYTTILSVTHSLTHSLQYSTVCHAVSQYSTVSNPASTAVALPPVLPTGRQNWKMRGWTYNETRINTTFERARGQKTMSMQQPRECEYLISYQFHGDWSKRSRLVDLHERANQASKACGRVEGLSRDTSADRLTCKYESVRRVCQVYHAIPSRDRSI